MQASEIFLRILERNLSRAADAGNSSRDDKVTGGRGLAWLAERESLRRMPGRWLVDHWKVASECGGVNGMKSSNYLYAGVLQLQMDGCETRRDAVVVVWILVRFLAFEYCANCMTIVELDGGTTGGDLKSRIRLPR